MTDAELHYLIDQLRIRAVIDLRDDREASISPLARMRAAGIEVHRVPLLDPSLASIRQDFGSSKAYIARHGCGRATIKALRDALVFVSADSEAGTDG